MIKGTTILVYVYMAFILFDPSSTFSYSPVKLIIGWEYWESDFEYLDTPMYVSTLIGCLFILIRISCIFHNVHEV